jgi:hypothetical protein
VLSRRGAVADARAAIAAAGFEDPVSDEQNRAQLELARAEALAAEGRFAEAAAGAQLAGEGAVTMGLGHPAVKAAVRLGSWCAWRAGDKAAAAAALERLDGLPPGALPRSLRAHRALLRALLAAPAEATARFGEAIAAARPMGNPWQLAIALAEQANAGIDAETALAETRTILTRLGAEPAFARLTRATDDRSTAGALG